MLRKGNAAAAQPDGEPATMQTYVITVKHDAGKIRITTAATSEEKAIAQVMIAENCPRSAIIAARRKPARKPTR